MTVIDRRQALGLDLPSGDEAALIGPYVHDRRSRWRVAATWLSGLIALAALVLFVLHLGDIEHFVDLARSGHPGWLFVALGAQILTYVCAAGVWHRVLAANQTPRLLVTLLPLGIAKVFTDQAVPTGGLSGALLVFRGLLRRRVRADVAMSALLVGMVSYYAAYLVAVLAAFAILRAHRDVSPVITYLVFAFALVALAIPLAVLGVGRLGRNHASELLNRIPGVAALLGVVSHADTHLLKRPGLLLETVALQFAIFLLDAATLWAALRTIGIDAGALRPFVAWVMASAAATLGPVPLGLGTFEAASTGMLHLMGIAVEPALAATLLLRGFTFWLPMLPGLFIARHELRGHKVPVE